jgi:hypothetical protein
VAEPPPASVPALDPAVERQLAAGLYNRVWDLMAAEPSAERNDAMIHAAHASRHHWASIGTAENLARGEWLCSRVYAVLGRGEPSMWHARRCLEICEENGIADWDIAGAYEAMARASAVSGDARATRMWVARAREACAAIADAEDREPIEADLTTIPAI